MMSEKCKTGNRKKSRYFYDRVAKGCGFRLYICLFLLLFLSGCAKETPSVISHQEKCQQTSEAEIIATLSEKTVDLSNPHIFEKKQTKGKRLQSYGIYTEKNTVLTVAHAVPIHSSLSGFSVKKRDNETELLLLSAETCGISLTVSSEKLKRGDTLYSCSLRNPLGKVMELDVVSYSKIPLSDSTKPIEGLARISGSFSAGDSGRGFCTASGELAGILVATTQVDAFLIPSEKIQKFLN